MAGRLFSLWVFLREREAIGERTAVAMRFKAENGEYTGGQAPYGFKVEGGELVEVEAEQRVLLAARTAKAKGLSLRAIARTLEARGLVARSGKAFGPAQVARMVA